MATVTIAQGTLNGGQSKTDSGFEYFEFLGIPYAKPPVGELRFKSPQSPGPWTGIKNATRTDSSTISCQVDFMTGSATGSEDCLYLNVYTPQLQVPEGEAKSVIVYFHGGGFMSGNGSLKGESGPDYLIENDVVFVTVNYRLGPLGFLNLEIPEAAGNMGLKDQVKALQWVQNNIDKFGGNKNKVTIFGASAGSAACDLLLISPLAKGLFHKCILQSASCLNHWTVNSPKKSKNMAVKLAQALGYTGPEDNMHSIYKVLFEASALQLTGLALQIAEKETLQGICFGFVPSIEKDFGNGEAFLVDCPYTLLKEGRFNQAAVLRGFCNKEGTLVSAMKPIAVKELTETKLFTDYWEYALESNDITKYKSKLVASYIDNVSPGENPGDFAVNFLGDLSIVAGIYLAGKLQSKKMPVYMYKFCYDGKLNVFKLMYGLMKPGAAHGDDSGYLLRHVGLSSRVPDDSDILMRSRMTKMWTNFAKTGNPTPESSDLPVQWPLFTEDSQQYLNIDKEITIEANYEPERMSIFEEVMDKYEL